MTLKEFKAKHGDIIFDEIKPDELDRLSCGAALFYMSLSNRNGPKAEKNVLYAGYILTLGLNRSLDELMFMRLTHGGRPKLDTVKLHELNGNGRAALFRTAAMKSGDNRTYRPYDQWN